MCEMSGYHQTTEFYHYVLHSSMCRAYTVYCAVRDGCDECDGGNRSIYTSCFVCTRCDNWMTQLNWWTDVMEKITRNELCNVHFGCSHKIYRACSCSHTNTLSFYTFYIAVIVSEVILIIIIVVIIFCHILLYYRAAKIFNI